MPSRNEPELPFSGKVAIVTGASGGIGSVTALALSAGGADVVLAAPSSEAGTLQHLAGRLRGGRALVVPTDVTSRSDVDRLAQGTLERFGRIDILANVHGIGSSPSLCDEPDDVLERVLDVNLLGCARTMQAVLPAMKARRSGSIVNVGSVAGEAGVLGIYSASKFGLRGLTDSVRREVRSLRIGVTLIEPGFVRTSMNAAMGDGLPSPDIVARAIVRAVTRPRRRVIVPAIYHIPVFLATVFPGLIDVVFGDARIQQRLNRDARAARAERTSGVSAVVISGASTGIGAATVERLVREGYVAFAGVRTDEDARRLRALGDGVRPVRLDVTDAASIESARREVAASNVPLRAVVSNAGIALGGPLETIEIDALRHQFEVNVFGALALVQAFLPSLPRGSGRVIFVGSISGRLSTPYIGPYSASKFALRALADALRVELSPEKLSVTLIEPGSVKTPIWEKGRANRSRIEERLGANPRPHYPVALAALLAQTEIEERNGMPASVVADAIYRAIASSRPPAQWLVGASARAGSVIASLPASWRDRAMRASMKLP